MIARVYESRDKAGIVIVCIIFDRKISYLKFSLFLLDFLIMSQQSQPVSEPDQEASGRVRRGKYSSVTDEISSRIIRAYENGADRQTLSKSFSIKRQTLNSILKVFEKENRIEKKVKGGS